MKNTLFAAAALLLCLCFACKGKENTPATPTAKPGISISETAIKEQKCIAKDRCADFDVRFPVLKGGDSLAVRIINDSIHQWVSASIQGFREAPKKEPVDSTARAFFAEYDLFTKENADFVAGWGLSADGKVCYQNAQYISVEVASSIFMGGAHPSSFLSGGTFDLSSGRQLKAADFVKDTVALQPLLVKAYLEEKAEAGEKLSDIVYEENKDHLPLPQVVFLQADGILFFYNSYEVAPYAMGPAGLLLKWETLGALANKQQWIK